MMVLFSHSSLIEDGIIQSVGCYSYKYSLCLANVVVLKHKFIFNAIN